ncbi:MAG: YesL family protein [Clostridia bacterium]|nr:YesL family protein [Clostridia bacterium]
MNRLFDLDSPLMSFLGKMADLLWLNILYILCCIPIITIGASTSALYYVTLKMSANEEGYITKSFFKSFKQNFKQATIIWLMMLVVGAVIFVDFRFLSMNETPFGKAIFIALCIICVLLAFVSVYIFPLLAKFDNTIKNSLKNALLISIRHFPYTIVLIVGMIVPFILIFLIMRLLPLLFLFAFSFTAYYCSFIFKKIFANYIPEEEETVVDEFPEIESVVDPNFNDTHQNMNE